MKRQIENIFFEIYKNFKIIFRNWSSLVLIILAPLFLILLVGYSFSGDTIHDVNIGIISQGGINLHEFEKNISSFGKITQYTIVDSCLEDLAFEKVHICIEILGSLEVEEGEIPTGTIHFYYDNTRKRISLVLLSQIKDFFGITSEKISLISAQELFSNLNELFVFLQSRITDIENTKNQSESILNDLVARREKLIELNADFQPKYIEVKKLQAELNSYEESFNNASNDLLDQVNQLQNITDNILGEINDNSLINSSDVSNLTLDTGFDTVSNITGGTQQTISNISRHIDSIIAPLDAINQTLYSEIQSADQYIIFINQSIIEMQSILNESKQRLEAFSELDPSLAEKIVKPITQTFTEAIDDLKDIQLAFPMLLLTVAIFISVIFSNILTSIEINNKAYTRNIIAPVNDSIFVIGMAITNFIIVIFQITVLFIVSQTRFGVDIIGNLPALIPIVAVLIFTFVFIGMIVSYLTKNPQTSILLATFISLAFFLLSDAVNAVEAMPIVAAKIASMNPVVIVNSMLRKIIFFDIPISEMASSFMMILIYMIIALVALIVVSKIKNKQRL